MNLTTDSWIPIVWTDGATGKVSLHEAFARGQEIRDLACGPHERIALMRLLICVAQAALDGPENREDWQACRDRIPNSVAAYLKEWRGAFELFGDGPRFLQVEGRGTPMPTRLDKLDFVDADMTTLFNPEVVPERAFPDDWIALRLLTFQCFAAGGCCGGSEVVNGKKQPQKGTNAPCRDGSAFHCYIRAGDLMETVHANLLTKESISMLAPLLWGQPMWELAPRRLTDIEETQGVITAYLSRLAPLSRSLWLLDDHMSVLCANGLRYPGLSADQVRLEPAIAVKRHENKKGNESRRPITAKIGESILHPWRELHAILISQQQGCGGPLCLQNTAGLDFFDFWVGSFVTNQSKVDESVDYAFSRIPRCMLDDPDANLRYAKGVSRAEECAWRLQHALAVYRIALERHCDSVTDAEASLRSLKGKERDALARTSRHALSAYWTAMENQREVLLDSVRMQDLAKWNVVARRAVRRAYDLACAHDTPRQYKAYALGLQGLLGKRAQGSETNDSIGIDQKKEE